MHLVRRLYHEREQKEKSKICPRYGGDLAVRNGRYGKFMGCSNFPECSYRLSFRVR
ncbi:MAG: topoisomerase DNA-binding C4 zinc finger domain-containing protein [Bacteroidales bacterium]|nr:topoisomerase DNA-binding C4 zinc finger domain-containing protein [Bacteroidales bacterium]